MRNYDILFAQLIKVLIDKYKTVPIPKNISKSDWLACISGEVGHFHVPLSGGVPSWFSLALTTQLIPARGGIRYMNIGWVPHLCLFAKVKCT